MASCCCLARNGGLHLALRYFRWDNARQAAPPWVTFHPTFPIYASLCYPCFAPSRTHTPASYASWARQPFTHHNASSAELAPTRFLMTPTPTDPDCVASKSNERTLSSGHISQHSGSGNARSAPSIGAPHQGVRRRTSNATRHHARKRATRQRPHHIHRTASQRNAQVAVRWPAARAPDPMLEDTPVASAQTPLLGNGCAEMPPTKTRHAAYVIGRGWLWLRARPRPG